ncbi:MAG TPA: TonB-dependent receptor [Allosphingosinicella sp.]|uniref:TonB-dependent receptor domain-containing protein n=1 Tax=Allosphingosinicella sp. TaxID=2823234 RepID=UPI002EDB8B6B
MRKFGLLGSSALRSIAFAGCALAIATPAYAQDVAGEDPPETLQSEQEVESGENATQGEEITVTGSRIRRPNLESNVPVTSIGGEQFIKQGDVNVGDTLNELPQLSSTFAQQNPGLGVGVAGLNLLDLRNLGTSRTLVLVNGRRHVAADIQNNAVSVDINTIPNDLIERVDIVTGAQSSVYGSDAIAGVVNFILRRDFEGLQVRGNTSIAQEGYGAEQYVSAMYGMNFGEGRGNVTVHGEFSNQERVYGSDIPEYARVRGLSVVDVDPAGSPNGSDGFPDRIFVEDLRSATINRYGLVPVTQLVGGTAPCGTSTSAVIDPTPNTSGDPRFSAPFNCTYVFDADGRLVPQTGTRFGTTINGGFLGGNGQSGREESLLSILPDLQRYNFNLLAHYEFSDAAEFFVEAKYARADAQGNNASPSFTQGGQFAENALGGTTPQRERIRLDNPFLHPADRETLRAAFLASGCDPTITGSACTLTTATGAASGTRLSAAEIAQINAGTYRFPIGKQFLDIGIRDEIFKRETYRGVVGLRGTFNEDWNYEVSANYGLFKQKNSNSGYVDRQRFLLSLDAAVNPATGQIQCRAQFDPAARVAFQSPSLTAAQNAFIAARLDADVAACVPYNPFGAGAGNRAAAEYFVYNSNDSAEIEQMVFSGFVSGDTSQMFELPAGPVRFAVGAEYRREDASYTNDPIVLQGVTNSLVLGNADPEDPMEVKEAFAEIQIPVLSDTPFFEELTLTAAGRVSDYNSIGTVYSYNAGLEWQPIQDLRFRANYGRSVRAPNLAETAFPLIPNFAPGFQDPCSGAQIGAGSATRQANCIADLGQALVDNLATLGAPSLPVISGSNPDLEEEKSDSYTLGVVIQPRFVPGFSFSADYYDITVNNVIVALGAQQIVNNCYDSPTLDNAFCPIFERYRGAVGTTGPNGEIAGQVLGNSLTQQPFNFAKRTRRGIDFEVAYRTRLGANARLNTNLIYVKTLEASNFQDPLNPDHENRILSELGTPQDEFRWDTDLTLGQFTLGYQLRYIGEMYVNTYEDYNSLNGNPPENADYADISQYPETFYHNIRVEWDVANGGGIGKDLEFYAGIDNLLDTYPPLGLTGTGTGGAGGDRGTGNAAIYETFGRTFYAGFKARF